MEKTKFKYSASKGVLELEGSEEFVTKHFESLIDIVRVISRQSQVEAKSDKLQGDQSNKPSDLPFQGQASKAVSENQQYESSINSYPEFFSEINGKLKIVSAITGATKKGKMLNAALLFCYGSELLGDDQVASKDIRQVCEEHGILDSTNFASVFSDKTIFLSDGVKGGSKEVKLTFQGKKKAKELLGNNESID